MVITRKVVAIVIASRAELKIVTANHANPLIVTISLQKLFTISEETRVRNAIIFQYYGLFDFLKNPADSG
tara:strand:- start:132071 stop:132280 length:210 start_codon:yes stop_codon:yes gene_type:complete